MRVVLMLLMLIPGWVWAQFAYRLSDEIPVIVEDDTLTLPWAGGFNGGQFNTMDLNQDGAEDLVLYDRTAGRVITFLRLNNEFQHAPAYEIYFPDEITNWVLLRDFNCDGRKDLFTGDVLGIKVYQNISAANEPPAWEHFFFDTGLGSKSPVLLTKGFSGKINLQLNADDLPSLSDADGDGDLDIFNVKFIGDGTIEFHQNFSMERYGSCDSLDFERITQAWGGVEECDCGDFAFNNEDCPTGGRLEHAGGKSLVAADLDYDGDQDILFSESECAQIFRLLNTGDPNNPMLTSASPFPVNQPVVIIPYPAVYLEDVDGDSQKDLIASPNIFFREFLQTDLRESAWYFRNSGTNELPQFDFQKTNFLQEDMIDVGDSSVPAFFDADADGDFDLFVGYFTKNFRASISYFENTGTRTTPEFTLVTDDLIGISLLNFTNIRPQFADVNGDAKTDLIFTASNQFGFNTNLYFIPNTSSAGLALTIADLQSLNFPVLPSENVCIAYVDDDQKPDLLVGKANGAVQYWKNTGSSSNPVFTLQEPAFLGLGSSVTRQNPSFATADLDSDGNQDLILGDQTGKLTIISDYREATDASGAITNILYNELEETFVAQNLGGRIWPTAVNICNTNRPSLVIGNMTGGLHILKHDESVPLPDSPQIEVYPNPVAGGESSIIHVKIDRPSYLYVLTLLGQQLGEPVVLQGYQTYEFGLRTLQKGVYILRFITGGKSYSRKMVVQ